MTLQLAFVYLLGIVSVVIGGVVIRRRVSLARFNKNAVAETFDNKLGKRAAEGSTPGMFTAIGVMAIFIGLVALAAAVLTTFGVLTIQPAP